MHKFFTDAQSALAFITTQATYIESEVDAIEYPEIQYPDLIPVDYTAPQWVKSVTYYSQDRVGKADWFSHLGRDVPRADVDRAQFETSVEMAAIGYGYTTEELAQAQMMGINLGPDKADAARESYEEFVDNIALYGDDAKGFSGLIDYPGVTAINAPNDGAATSRAWTSKTPDLIARDINLVLTGIFVDTLQIGMADTILLPLEDYTYIATTRFDPNGNMTILDWIEKTNIYTKTTGQALMVRAVRGLETAGSGGSGRLIGYKRDPKVLKMHIPMRHQFLEVMRTGPLLYEVPGIFRLGGLDVRRPAMIRYLDQIS